MNHHGRRHQSPLRLLLLKTGLQFASWFTPQWAAKWAYKLFVTPFKDLEPAWEGKITSQAHIRHLPLSDGSRIAVYDWGGDGPLVLLAHGWRGRIGQLGAFVAPLKQQGYHVVGFDQPAHGRSSGQRCHIPCFANAITELAQALNTPCHALIGHDAGGTAALRVAAQGLEVNYLVTLGAPCLMEELAKQALTRLGLNHSLLMRLRKLMEAEFNTSWTEYDAHYNAAHSHTPGLIFHDLGDQDVSYAHAKKLKASWAEAELITTINLGHDDLLKDSAVIKKCLEFIDQHQKKDPNTSTRWNKLYRDTPRLSVAN